MSDLTSFPKKKYRCSNCGYIWMEFMPLKCPKCDALFGLKEAEKQ